MGKTAKKSGAPKRDLSEEDATTVATLKKAGNDAFAGKEYTKALDSYERALKVLPEDHSEAALLHSNKAACNMMLKKYKEAINECTAALDTQPNYHKALVRRAKAYEQIGHYKAALGDVHQINKGEGGTPETEETERRLREILSGKKPAGNSAVAAPAVGKKKSVAARGQQAQVFQAKCTLGNETRLVTLMANCTIVELMHQVKAKFPTAGPFMLKYLDREGDLVTLTSRQDIARAFNEAVLAGEALGGGHGPRLGQAAVLPALRVQVVECDPLEVPELPVSEQEEIYKMLKQQSLLFQELEARQAPKAPPAEAEQPQMVELDQWIVDFANLFREHSGLDFDRHLDLNNVAWDRLQTALELTIGDEKAWPLLDEAEKKFLEVSASGMLQVGNVYTLRARQVLDKAVLAGESVDSVRDQVAEHFGKAEERFQQALGIKGDLTDCFHVLSDLEMQRAKLAAGFHAPLPRGPTRAEQEAAKAAGTAKSDAEINADHQKAVTEVTHSALAKLPAEAAARGSEHWQKSYGYLQSAIDAIPEADRTVRQLPEQKEGDTPPPEEPISAYQNALLAWGNILYEESQLAAAAGSDWKPTLDAAVEKFRAAGCNEPDIRGALKNHWKADDLDLGPDPEPEAAPAAEEAAKPEANGEAAPAQEPVKGLGSSLGPAPKKKAAKEATATA